MITIHNLGKNYGEKAIVSGIDLTLTPGKLTAFIGPNGAGKSTMLSMISRLSQIDCGEIYLEGTEIRSWKQNNLAKKLAVLRQTNHTALKLTVRELVSYGRFPHSQGKLTVTDYQKVNQALASTGLKHLAGKPIHHLSGGQLQRAYIAMILAQDTAYILLDEPLNNLDLNYSVQIMKTLKKLVTDNKKTILLVVHDINFASHYADEIVAMKEGLLFAQGTVEEIITKPLLESLYETPFTIETINNKRFCSYF